MNFITRLSTASSNTGLTDEKIEWLEKFFSKALNGKTELSSEDFKRITNSKNTFFAERVFEIFDVDKSGSVSLIEFIAAMQNFAGQSPDEKLKFLFRIYDINGDGQIQRNELEEVIKGCMAENGMNFSADQIEELTEALFEDADADMKGDISFKELKAQIMKHDGLLQSLSISIDQWLIPPKPPKTLTLSSKMMSLKPRQMDMAYVKNNYVFYAFVSVFFAVNVGLFVSRGIAFSRSNGYTIVARACGQCLNFNCMFILVLMLRQTITFLRSRGFGRYLPLDHHIYLHKVCGWLILAYSVLHALMHVINFATVLVYDQETEGVNEFNCTIGQMYFTACPQKLGLVPGWANPTGFLLLVILIVMIVCSLSFVRKTGNFEIFAWTHFLYVAFFILLILHGPNFWKWIVIPGVIFCLEKGYRNIQTKTQRGKTFVTAGIVLPSKVINLVIRRPKNFHFHPGDYLFVKIPKLAKHEWHPFTISSAPEQKDNEIWLHIRAAGQWTKRLYEHYEKKNPMNTQTLTVRHKSNGRSFSTKARVSDASTLAMDNAAFEDTENLDSNKVSFARPSSDAENNPNHETALSHKSDKPDFTSVNIDVRKKSNSSNVSASIAGNGQKVRRPSLEQKLEIVLDGPYGSPSSHIFRAEHAVLVAAGIGVTPFASILQSIMHRYLETKQTCPNCSHGWSSALPDNVMSLKKVDFFWINRDQQCFEWFVNLLSELEIEQAEQGSVMDRFLDMHMYITSALHRTDMKAVGLQLALDLLHDKVKRDLITGLKTRTKAGRPNWTKVFRELQEQRRGRVTVFYCGPPLLGRILRDKCAEFGFDFRKENF